MKYQKPISIVAGVMLLLAIPSMWPYGYYELLRLVICAVAVINTILFFKAGRSGWAITMALVALLFNPVAPVHLSKGVWILFDLAAAFVMFLSIPEYRDSRQPNAS